ncbi:hypothetical protein [Bradyrhizobium cenepequi]|uniref:hypothetical protein n=1 Tax=Bradyrhizobium cenepequi TaxID=2821403 RepID=UPI001CE29301|nr:hypothetical protein [Bradyrhizobium cenepequi]MCA6110468.1 hypothetical protein [Bradyrhizobium cenepequi]
MARQNDTKTPIMTLDQERFMAFEGLVQWTACTIEQGKKIERATERQRKSSASGMERRIASAMVRCEHHYFAIAANKVCEHREWVARLGLCEGVDFTSLDEFSRSDIKDLRDMREHVIDYFEGIGRAKDRWVARGAEYSADASSSVGTIIGGRLDWLRFTNMAEGLLLTLLAEPIPFPPAPHVEPQ